MQLHLTYNNYHELVIVLVLNSLLTYTPHPCRDMISIQAIQLIPYLYCWIIVYTLMCIIVFVIFHRSTCPPFYIVVYLNVINKCKF